MPETVDFVETQLLANYTQEDLQVLLNCGWEVVWGNLDGILLLERRTPICSEN